MRRGSLFAALVLGLATVARWCAPEPRARGEGAREAELAFRSAAPESGRRAAGGNTDPVAREPATAARPTEAATELEPAAGMVSAPVLHVRFVDERANPVAGVELRDTARPRSAVRADHRGFAELVVERTGLPLELEARSPGSATARRRLSASLDVETWLEDWTLVDSGVVTGQVLDENGAAIAGARVAVADEHGARSATWEDALASADGRFVLASVPAGSRRLVALAGGRAAAPSEALEVVPGGHLEGVEIRMKAAGSATRVSGIVLTPSGDPLPGARVDVRASRSSYRLTAGPDGAFEFDPGPGARCRLLATDPRSRHGEAVLEDVPAGRAGLELWLTGAETIALLVRGPDGPVERFWALTISANDQVLAAFPEEPRPGGELTFARPSSPFRVEVHANGWRPVRLGPFEPEATPATIGCSLEPARGVSGRVLHADLPVAGATVTLHPASESETLHNGFPVRHAFRPANATESATDGRFLLSVEVAGDYFVRAELAGLAPTEIGPLPLDPHVSREADLVLGPGGTLAVRVRSSAGRGVAGTLVALSRGDGGARTWRCDASGECLVEALTPGPWQVELAATEIDPRYGATRFGTGPVRVVPSNCVVREGQTTRVDLWLEDRGSRACRLSGRLAIDGEPARGFVARLARGRSLLDPVPLADDGAFRVAADEPGSYALVLAPAGPDQGRMPIVRDALELFEGDAHWSFDLQTGVLDAALPVATPLAEDERLFQRWSRGTLEVFVPLVPDADGRVRHDRAALGPTRIVSVRADRSMLDQTPRDLGILAAAPR